MLFRATQLTNIEISVCCLRTDCLATVHKTVVSNFHYVNSLWAFLSYFVFWRRPSTKSKATNQQQ